MKPPDSFLGKPHSVLTPWQRLWKSEARARTEQFLDVAALQRRSFWQRIKNICCIENGKVALSTSIVTSSVSVGCVAFRDWIGALISAGASATKLGFLHLAEKQKAENDLFLSGDDHSVSADDPIDLRPAIRNLVQEERDAPSRTMDRHLLCLKSRYFALIGAATSFFETLPLDIDAAHFDEKALDDIRITPLLRYEVQGDIADAQVDIESFEETIEELDRGSVEPCSDLFSLFHAHLWDEFLCFVDNLSTKLRLENTLREMESLARSNDES